MAGKKFGVVLAAKVPGSYFALSESEQEKPGKIMEQLSQKYAGKVDLVRRLWTSAFTAEVSDVFFIECDDLMDVHRFSQEMAKLFSEGGNPERFGTNVKIFVGVNPDA